MIKNYLLFTFLFTGFISFGQNKRIKEYCEKWKMDFNGYTGIRSLYADSIDTAFKTNNINLKKAIHFLEPYRRQIIRDGKEVRLVFLVSSFNCESKKSYQESIVVFVFRRRKYIGKETTEIG